MFCVHEVVAPLCVTLALPIQQWKASDPELIGIHIPGVFLGAQGHQLPCVTNLAPNKGLEALP